MTLPGFKDSETIKKFIGLKKFFRSHETKISRERIEDFKKFSKLINYGGDEVAFDILGSLNFGQATVDSDTDIVMYTRCEDSKMGECGLENCYKISLFKHMFLNLVTFEHNSNAYKLEIVDCINLNQLEKDIADGNESSALIIRFCFYRSICRGVNRKLLHRYENMISERLPLWASISKSVEECFDGIIVSSQHTYSFHKYAGRLEEKGIKLPGSMAAKIKDYLKQ
ncbi:hypothetical protein LEP1GSC047_1757 [Leptospira inadai serovar Lyme str. 10]|uniref:Uncharacterized protein n=2 Tax=Leptospira inadai serovar Lyme TaxID=293084 RepID=V6HS65_9LEPT|nr:hypothetical protein [Leptospira inadai]EQA35419.1 hypothetical protein LEP1GSC047_1757 [Leptospira inadai serovar Lyme str. 10]PNV76178.1 hypothetical protein BES34_004005 [Leptospira inadai serovar Lyme]